MNPNLQKAQAHRTMIICTLTVALLCVLVAIDSDDRPQSHE